MAHKIRLTTGNKIVLSLALAGGFLLVGMLGAPKASAYYNGAGNLIDNLVYRDTSTMSKSAIQSFLASKNSGLANMSFTLECYSSGSKERRLYTSVGASCDKKTPASAIIYYAGKVYGINPQVILSTMQKEQSLVTNPNPSQWNLDNAMGYGCNSGSTCESSGFFRQIDWGTWVLRLHYERARGNMTWWTTSSSWVCGNKSNDNGYTLYRPGLIPGQKVTFYDGAGYKRGGVAYRTVKIANAATSALHCYTPHAYNNPQGLYGYPKYGTVGQYYSGSYWFVVRFTQWFGSPYGSPQAIYRLYNARTNNHLYTKSRSERDKAMRVANFRYEGTAFSSCRDGGRPVYRLYSPRTGRHLFTVSERERDKAARKTSYQKEGVAFRVCGNDPVYRLYSGRVQKHFYTQSRSERDKLNNKTSFDYEGIGFRVY